jgi:signal transduction histidine kinase
MPSNWSIPFFPKKQPKHMPANENVKGLCFLSDEKGQILKVFQDDLDAKSRFKKGQLFGAQLDQGSLGKALDFLLEIKSNGCTFDWKFSLTAAGRKKSLTCGGIQAEQGLLIFGAWDRSRSLKVYEQAVTKGYVNLRKDKMQTPHTWTPSEKGSDMPGLYFDEMTRLNNELAQLQRELAKKNVELEKLNKLKSQFLGMAAHDIRNALWVIQLSSRVLLQECGHLLDEEQLDSLNMIFSSSKSVQKIIDKFLNVVNITEGRIELNPQNLDVMLLVSHCVKLNKSLAEKNGISFLITPKDKEIPAWVDPTAMEQVLNNLLSNAIKYSPKNGQIRISAKDRKDDILLSVKDQGPGIPPENQKSIFEPFVRDGKKRIKHQKSFGLGLAIVKKIVEAHKGRVWFDSKKSEGTVFFVSLPKVQR